MNKLSKDYIKSRIKEFCDEINECELDEKIEMINDIRESIHQISPFKSEPVDFVRWVKNSDVYANDYNPNTVAPPEMELLKLSIEADGYTQPIVSFATEKGREVIDGFHRHRVGKEYAPIQQRVLGHLPVVTINHDRTSKSDRIASTIRHNRARGKHGVSAMSEIVIELKNRNWTNQRIAKELGMDEDEVLRLCQITGLESLFKDDDFSKSWNIEDSVLEVEDLTDDITDDDREQIGVRTVNTSDKNRIFHTYEKWECFKAGFYATNKPGMTTEQCEREYYNLLTDKELFESTLNSVIIEWKYSCEHYLTNNSMNRIAWLGQASLCYAKQIPSCYRSGWNLLNEQQQQEANELAHKYLNKWLVNHGLEEVSLHDALLADKQTEIY